MDEPDAIHTVFLYELYHGSLDNARSLLGRLSGKVDKKTYTRCKDKLITITPAFAESMARVRATTDSEDIRRASMTTASARRFIQQKKWDEAYPLLRQAVETYPLDWTSWYLLASAASARKLTTEAATCYHRAIALRPGNTDLWSGLGKLRLARNELGLALASFRQAARINPGNPVAMQGRVEILIRLNRKEEARRVQEEWEKNR